MLHDFSLVFQIAAACHKAKLKKKCEFALYFSIMYAPLKIDNLHIEFRFYRIKTQTIDLSVFTSNNRNII